MAIEKIKILGVVLELPAKQHCQFSPFGPFSWWIGQFFQWPRVLIIHLSLFPLRPMPPNLLDILFLGSVLSLEPYFHQTYFEIPAGQFRYLKPTLSIPTYVALLRWSKSSFDELFLWNKIWELGWSWAGREFRVHKSQNKQNPSQSLQNDSFLDHWPQIFFRIVPQRTLNCVLHIFQIPNSWYNIYHRMLRADTTLYKMRKKRKGVFSY